MGKEFDCVEKGEEKHREKVSHANPRHGQRVFLGRWAGHSVCSPSPALASVPGEREARLYQLLMFQEAKSQGKFTCLLAIAYVCVFSTRN